MRLRWKHFLVYLGACAGIIAAASIAFRGVAVRAAYSHMGGMMTAMMPGVTRPVHLETVLSPNAASPAHLPARGDQREHVRATDVPPLGANAAVFT